jgi:SOS-response transcriptional repressor LexA
MGSLREPDPLVGYLLAQQTRVLEWLTSFASGEGGSALSKVRPIVRALGDAETEVLYPAFSRLQLPLEIQYLLTDSRDSRARQLEALDALAHKRMPHLRTLAAIELAEHIQRHFEQHVSELIPVLASRLPRPVYRSIVSRFVGHCQLALERAKTDRRAPRRAQATVR